MKREGWAELAAWQDRHRWIAVALAAEAWRRFRLGWRQLPKGTAQRWLRTLAAGTAAVALLTAGLTWAGHALARAGVLAWEPGFLLWLQDRTPEAFKFALWIGSSGNSIVALSLTVFAAGWAAWHYRPLHALSFAAGVPLFKLLVLLGWALWHRARPDLIEDGLAAPDGLSSYPSGHVVQALFVYGLLAYFWASTSRSPAERAVAALLVAVVVALNAFSRLRVGAHWPSDLVAGAVVGAAWLGAVVLALRRAERHPQ